MASAFGLLWPLLFFPFWLHASGPDLIPARSSAFVSVHFDPDTPLPPHIHAVEVGNLIGSVDSLSPIVAIPARSPVSFSTDPSIPDEITIELSNPSDVDYVILSNETIAAAFIPASIAPQASSAPSSIRHAADIYTATQTLESLDEAIHSRPFPATHDPAPNRSPPFPPNVPSVRAQLLNAALQHDYRAWSQLTTAFLPVIAIAPGLALDTIDGTVTLDGRRMITVAALGPGGGPFPHIHPSSPFPPALQALESALPRWTWPSSVVLAFPEHLHPEPESRSSHALLLSARLASWVIAFAASAGSHCTVFSDPACLSFFRSSTQISWEITNWVLYSGSSPFVRRGSVAWNHTA